MKYLTQRSLLLEIKVSSNGYWDGVFKNRPRKFWKSAFEKFEMMWSV